MKLEKSCSTKLKEWYDANKRTITLIILAVTFILIMVTERFYNESMYESSFEKIKEYDKDMPAFAITTFSWFSESGGGRSIAFYTIL